MTPEQPTPTEPINPLPTSPGEPVPASPGTTPPDSSQPGTGSTDAQPHCTPEEIADGRCNRG